MARTSAEDRVIEAVQAARKGLTAAEVASALDLTERTARKHLAAAYAAGRLSRTPEYEKDATPPRFLGYRYSSRAHAS
jgi:predicted ArsR family transcriptional regulator